MTNYAPAAGSPAALSYLAGATITGGQLVEITGPGTVTPAAPTAGAYAGVAAHNADPGDAVTVLCGAGVWHDSVASAILIPGIAVVPGAGGTVTQGVITNQIGVTVTGAAAGDVCRWLAYK